MPVADTAGLRIASAPVNFGVFDPVESGIVAGIGPQEMLRVVFDAGYDGIDLGPVGYLGTGESLGRRLADAGLHLAGGWVDLRYSSADGFTADLAKLDGLLAELAAGGASARAGAAPPPRPTLGCSGTAAAARSGRGSIDRRDYAARVQIAADRCRERGLEPVFHPHLGTHVVTPAEIEQLLDRTNVALCLDTGHLLLGGGDPVAAVKDWSDRIRQVHLKDASIAVFERAVAESSDVRHLVGRGIFRPLGTGDVDLRGVLDALRSGYTGWIVVEQDVLPGTSLDRIVADQLANRQWLRGVGL